MKKRLLILMTVTGMIILLGGLLTFVNNRQHFLNQLLNEET